MGQLVEGSLLWRSGPSPTKSADMSLFRTPIPLRSKPHGLPKIPDGWWTTRINPEHVAESDCQLRQRCNSRHVDVMTHMLDTYAIRNMILTRYFGGPPWDSNPQPAD